MTLVTSAITSGISILLALTQIVAPNEKSEHRPVVRGERINVRKTGEAGAEQKAGAKFILHIHATV